MPSWQDASYSPICFSGIKQRVSATSNHSAMPSRRRATHSEASTYIGPAFDPSRVLLRRVFFLDDEKSRYVSVGFYPACNYQPLVEFCGTRSLPLVLPTEYVNVVTELPGLVEGTCRNEKYTWCSEDGDFKIHNTRAYRTARFTYAKHWISLKLPELRTQVHIPYDRESTE